MLVLAGLVLDSQSAGIAGCSTLDILYLFRSMSLVGKPLIEVRFFVSDRPAESHKRRSGTLPTQSPRHSTLPKPTLRDADVGGCLPRIEKIHTDNICRHKSPRFITDGDETMATNRLSVEDKMGSSGAYLIFEVLFAFAFTDLIASWICFPVASGVLTISSILKSLIANWKNLPA
jgi:hypothetical protein